MLLFTGLAQESPPMPGEETSEDSTSTEDSETNITDEESHESGEDSDGVLSSLLESLTDLLPF